MPPFKDDQIIIISPGSEITLAQLGLPESFTPAALRIRSRMFPAEKEGEWEPNKIRRKEKPSTDTNGTTTTNGAADNTDDDEVIYEEDTISEEGAVWPLTAGRITNYSCFFALLQHVYATLNPPFHTPILLIAQPVWTARDHEKITQFFFEKFKIPAFALVDSAIATLYAYGVHSATVVDVGRDKTDITAVTEFLAHQTGRTVALPEAGGEALTQRLVELIRPKDRHFNRDMAEQLKKSPVCEVLPAGVPLPGSGDESKVTNPAAAASTGAVGSGPGQRETAGALGNAPMGPGAGTEVGDDLNGSDENEGVLDVASIVAGGKMNEYLARKEKEKAEKEKNKKKGGTEPSASAAAKPNRLPNSKREKATFMYEDHKLLDTLKGMNLSVQGMTDMRAALDEGPKSKTATEGETAASGEPTSPVVAGGSVKAGSIRREVDVGIERFQAASGGILERIADAIHKTVSSVEEVNKRSELWDSLIIVGNGSKLRGFKDALIAALHSKYIISPSSATIFTSELPSNMSTPAGTGANTPQPQLGPHGGPSGVNPLLLAATTAQNPHMMHLNTAPPSIHSHSLHSSHGQTPTSIKLAKVPEYFPEWKEVGYDEATFLGAQVAAKVLFVVDQGLGKGYMTRNDWNDSGPMGIHDFSI